jgi:hypothetical protein
MVAERVLEKGRQAGEKTGEKQKGEKVNHVVVP